MNPSSIWSSIYESSIFWDSEEDTCNYLHDASFWFYTENYVENIH